MKIKLIRYLISIFAILLFLINCHKKTDDSLAKTNYKVTGSITNNNGFNKVYLNYIVREESVLMDSAEIKENTFLFKGKISDPKKAFLQMSANGKAFPFILAGEEININLNINDLEKSTVYNSNINSEWQRLKQKSEMIYGEIAYLYPTFQKARIMNDEKTLEKIQKQIDSFEILNRSFLIDYVQKNVESPLAVLILNDLYHTKKNDCLRIIQTAKMIDKLTIRSLEFKLE